MTMRSQHLMENHLMEARANDAGHFGSGFAAWVFIITRLLKTIMKGTNWF